MQIVAAVRCKQSKLRFFFGALYGKKWREDELFHPQALVQDHASQLLQQYNASQQVSPKQNKTKCEAQGIGRQFCLPRGVGRLLCL